jgi:hypothetical protein
VLEPTRLLPSTYSTACRPQSQLPLLFSSTCSSARCASLQHVAPLMPATQLRVSDAERCSVRTLTTRGALPIRYVGLHTNPLRLLTRACVGIEARHPSWLFTALLVRTCCLRRLPSRVHQVEISTCHFSRSFRNASPWPPSRRAAQLPRAGAPFQQQPRWLYSGSTRRPPSYCTARTGTHRHAQRATFQHPLH